MVTKCYWVCFKKQCYVNSDVWQQWKKEQTYCFLHSFPSNQSGSKNSRSFIPMSSVFPVASMPFSFFPKDDHHMKLCKVSPAMNILGSQVSTSRILANSCDVAWSKMIYRYLWHSIFNYNGLCGFGTNEVAPQKWFTSPCPHRSTQENFQYWCKIL